MKGQTNLNGAASLTNTISGMIKSISDKPPVLSFGVINSDFSLSINGYSCPIPITDYSVCRSCLYNPEIKLTETYTDGEHGHPDASPPGTHKHDVRLPKKMRRLKPGDRVLVAIIDNEFCVIDKIYDAKYLATSGEPDWS